MNNLYLVFCAVFFSAGIVNGSECPPPEDMYPCQCFGYGAVMFHCADIMNSEDLLKVFTGSSLKSIDTFRLVNSSMIYIPASIFDSVSIKHMVVLESAFITLFDVVPKENDVQTLVIINSKIIRTLDWKLLSTMTSLHTLYIENTIINRIWKDFSDNIPSENLNEIVFINTGSKAIHETAFARLQRLSSVTVRNNRVKTIQRSMFPRPSYIRTLNLTNNRIDALPEDIFSDFERLQMIYLRNNSITTIPESIFGTNFVGPRNVFLEINDNPINCDCKMAWVPDRLKEGGLHIHGKCYSEGKYGKHLSDLTNDDFNCP